jgi:hypothetical protein
MEIQNDGRMFMKDQHIPQSELVAAADGELSETRAVVVRTHLTACWACRSRMKEIEDAITQFVRAHQETIPAPPVDAPRALLRARLAELAKQPPPSLRDRLADYFLTGNRLAYAGAVMAGIAAIMFVVGVIQVSKQQFRLEPDPLLTPGAVLPVTEAQVCAGSSQPRMISAKVGRQVFDRYGIDRPRPRDYELDRLIAVELGGSDDPRNFWPQPYGTSEWNAHVKDALEDRLHELVCENKVSLETAQHDISSDWIAAYKKYFQTQRPIASHKAFTKDSPWEP